MKSDYSVLFLLVGGLGIFGLAQFWDSLSPTNAVLFILILSSLGIITTSLFWEYFSKAGKERLKKMTKAKELPEQLRAASSEAVLMGQEQELGIPIYLPDRIRARHVHVLGSTGSGKTESIILNFLKQDSNRGLGSIVLDAKGDADFLWNLRSWVPVDRLKVFDLGSSESQSYNPLEAGSALESAQRLFSSFTWSEEYYKSKALAALQKTFQAHRERHKKNPTLVELSAYLEDPDAYAGMTASETYPQKLAIKDFGELSGLRDQIRSLCIGHLGQILSPKEMCEMDLESAKHGQVLYFRLQSLLSPQVVSIVGKLLINHLNFLAGTAHRGTKAEGGAKLVPTYLDEFATFACPEFADLISKARSAGFALHFSHQSIGDLAEVSKGFLNQITDNSATKIVMRINDPDSADFLARAFGTRLYQKLTQRITNAQTQDDAEMMGEGSQREAHQFRAAPDLFKTLPTGMGSVLIAHGYETPHGASSVFKIKFPQICA